MKTSRLLKNICDIKHFRRIQTTWTLWTENNEKCVRMPMLLPLQNRAWMRFPLWESEKLISRICTIRIHEFLLLTCVGKAFPKCDLSVCCRGQMGPQFFCDHLDCREDCVQNSTCWLIFLLTSRLACNCPYLGWLRFLPTDIQFDHHLLKILFFFQCVCP